MEQCWAVRKKDKNILHVAEMRMLRWISRSPERTTSETSSYKRMPNVNNPETKKIKLVRTYQEKRRRQPLEKKMMDMVVPGKRRRGRPRRRWIDKNREDMNIYEMTAYKMENDGEDWPTKMGDGL